MTVFAILLATVCADSVIGRASAWTGATFTISIDQGKWEKFGFQYPVTYVFQLPSVPPDAAVHRRDQASDRWTPLEKKTADDFFNGVECVRFGAAQNKAYVANRKDVWYVANGWLYSYRYVAENARVSDAAN